GHVNVSVHRQSQHETLVVVGVVAQQFEPARRGDVMGRSEPEPFPEKGVEFLHGGRRAAQSVECKSVSLDGCCSKSNFYVSRFSCYAISSHFRASAKSSPVSPSASWVVSNNFTLFQRISMSG